MSQKEGQEDEGTSKQLGQRGYLLPILPLRDAPGDPSGSSTKLAQEKPCK